MPQPPSTAGRPLTPAATRILDTAGALFFSRGIHAVGVDLIAEQAGTTKKTLYDRFGSKAGLVSAYLSTRRARWEAFVLSRVDGARDRGVPAAELPLVVLDALEEWMGEDTRGCGFVNAYAELSGSTGGADDEALADVRAEKSWVRGLYRDLLQQAGHHDVERCAAGLALLHEGAIVRRTAGASTSAFEDARDAARILLTARPDQSRE